MVKIKLEILKKLPEKSSNLPTLLFVHGASHGMWCWQENFIPYFSSKNFPVYALDLRGHGKSEGFNDIDSFSLSQYADDVMEVMNQLDENVILIGHSMGGAVVQKILSLHPKNVKAAVLLSSVPHSGMFKDLIKLLFTQFKNVRQAKKSFSCENVRFPFEVYVDDNIPSEKIKLYSSLIQLESKKASLEIFTSIVPKNLNVHIPMLIVGSKCDKIVSAKSVALTAKFYKTKPIILNNLSHDMMLDSNWKIVADIIYDFCAALPRKKYVCEYAKTSV